MTGPPSLYVLCMEYSIPKIERYSKNEDWNDLKGCSSIERLGASIAEDLLGHAFRMANRDNINKIWKDEWSIFYTSNMISAIVSWNYDLIKSIGSRCKKMRRLEVVHVKNFKPEPILVLPETVITVDFDGELIMRGHETKALQFEEEETQTSWLPHAEELLKALQILRKKPPEYVPTPGILSLCELNLGITHVTAADLKVIIQNCPCLRLLRHYQLVSALYELHAEAWKKKEALPTYKLKNLDADFSHVVRSTMLPTWVLAPNALQLAVQLCPNAISIRLRYDNSTPNDVIAPLMTLEKIKEFSAVCVSSGERVLLDFTDMSPIFQKYGPLGLSFLELKVIEEVEIHVIIENCTKIETLILSGCGYVTPPTCGSYNCEAYTKGSLSKKLKLLFYVDGDDFSWDHGVPECFWKATLFPSGKNRIVHLEGLFLELPRISPVLGKEIFHQPKNTIQRLPFPELRVTSLCKYEDITIDDIASLVGLSKNIDKSESLSNSSVLKYIRLTECEKIDEAEGKKLHNWFKEWGLNRIKLHVDR